LGGKALQEEQPEELSREKKEATRENYRGTENNRGLRSDSQ